MNKIEGVTLGSDLELFLQDKESGEFISAEGIIQGTKDKPYKFDPENEYYATSLDNVSAEGNIPPCVNSLEFYNAVEKLRKYIDSIIPQNLKTVATASARLSWNQLDTPNARLFGCESSYNCWTFKEERPQAKATDNLRCCGGHVHVGYTNPNFDTSIEIGRAMDLFLGVASILIEPINERKQVGYGTAGNMRMKPYGLEYRTLSSYFFSTKELIEWVYDSTTEAIKFVNEGRIEDINPLGDVIQRVINNNDKVLAQELIEMFNIKLP